MGIWDAPAAGFPAAMGDGPLARLLQTLMAQRGENVPYIEPPGAGMPRPNNDLPLPSATDVAAMGGGHVTGRSGGSAEGALASLLGMTGLPDIQAGAQAMGRGEYMPGFGQAAFGLGSLGALGAPMARGAMMAGREALGAVPGVLADTRGAIRAFHGSPYDFDRFDMSKIGTGEGAQAYGHGLYFAERPGVAESYKQMGEGRYLTNDGPLLPHGDLWAGMEKAAQVAGNLHPDQAGQIARAILNGIDELGSAEKYLAEYEFPPGAFGKAYQAAADYAVKLGVKKNPGKMYEARINADPEHFLDWDKPLSQQSEHVRRSIRKVTGPGNLGEDRGRTLYDMIANGFDKRFFTGGQEETTQALRDAGIPGIRYLDQGSRGAGEGTSNYVVFDDKLIDIIRKYGLAGLIAPGALAPSYMGDR